MQLDNSQEKLISDIGIALRGKEQRTALVQLPTGGGKTVIFSAISKRFIEKSKQDILIVVHREELLKQTRSTIFKWYGIIATEISANFKMSLNQTGLPGLGSNTRIFVAMIETINNRLKNTEFLKMLSNVGLLIVDECHLGNFKKIFKHFPESKILGFTATPYSINKRDPLKNYYQKLVCGSSIRELIDYNKNVDRNRGVVQDLTYTIKNKSQILQVREEIENRHKEAGLFDKAEYDDKIVGDVLSDKRQISNTIEAVKTHASGRKLLCFNANVAHSKEVHRAMSLAGLKTRHIDGSCGEEYRRETFSWLAKTNGAILNNVGIATTGFDDPSIEGCVINKLTKSPILWKQMCGRSARPYKYEDGSFKEHHLILDMGDNVISGGMGEWSDDINWYDIFYKIKEPKDGVAPAKLCPECGCINPASARICKGIVLDALENETECGYEFPIESKEEDNVKREMILISKNIDVQEIIEKFQFKNENTQLYEICRQAAWFYKQGLGEQDGLFQVGDLPEITEEIYQDLYDSTYLKVMQWIKLVSRKNSGYYQHECKRSLIENLEKYGFTKFSFDTTELKERFFSR